MSKRLVYLFLLLVSTNLYSQSNYVIMDVPKTEVGFVLGMNKARLVGSEDIVYSRRKTGILGGISFIKNISPAAGINVELLYGQRTWEDYSNLFGPTDTMSYNSNMTAGYFLLPVLGKFHPGEMRNFTIEAGVQTSFLMGTVQWEEDSGIKVDQTERFKTFDAGLLLGFGSQFRMKDKGHFFIKFRNYFGLTGFDNVSTSDGKGFNVNSVQFMFGITRFMGK